MKKSYLSLRLFRWLQNLLMKIDEIFGGQSSTQIHAGRWGKPQKT